MSAVIEVRFGVKQKKVGAYCLYLLCVALSSCFAFTTLAAHAIEGWLTWRCFSAAFFGVFAVLLFIYLWRNNHARAEHIFALIAPVLLCMFVFFMMPYAVPDEFTHINRIFDNRAGEEVIYVPSQLQVAFNWITSYSVLWDLLHVQFDYESLVATDYSASAYSVVCYFVPSIIVSIGSMFDINGYWLIFGARLANAFLYLCAGFWMLKTMPVAKPFLLVFLLNPMLLQQEASCSADVLCNIGALCFVVQVLYMRFNRVVDLRNCLKLVLFFVLVVLCKYAYLPICLIAIVLYPLISSKSLRFAIPVVAVLGSVGFVFMLAAVGYSGVLNDLFSGKGMGQFAQSLVLTLQEESLTLLWQFSGGNLGWPYMNQNFAPTTISVPLIWILYLITLGLSFVSSFDDSILLRAWERLLIVLVCFAEILLLFFALWQGSNTSSAVTWNQGRYFIPSALPLAVAIMPRISLAAREIPLWTFGITVGVLDLLSLMWVAYFF